MVSAKDLFDGSITLVALGVKLAEVIKRAVESTRVEVKVMLYLQAAQAAIHALGRERQIILADAGECNIRNLEKVETLWKRMNDYLTQDNVRTKLGTAIEDLGKYQNTIEDAAHGLLWRTRDKEVAVKTFVETLRDLDVQYTHLKYAFYPEFSGQGLDTLVPIFNLIGGVRNNLRQGRPFDVQADEEKLGELVRDALRDPAHEDWMQKSRHIEGLIVDLKLAFSVSSIEDP